MYGPPMGHFETKTEQGLKYINWGIMLYLVTLFMLLIVAIGAIMLAGTVQEPGAGLGALGAILAAACLAIVLLFIVVILWLLGFATMVAGKEEYGPIHSKKVMIALMCFILFIIFFALTILVPIMSIGTMVNVQDPEEIWDDFRGMIIISTAMSFLSTVFLSLTWVFLIIELAADNIKKLLWVAFLINVITSLVALIVVIMMLNVDVTDMDFEQVNAMQNMSNLSSAISIVGFIILVYCYWKTYNRVKNREIMPVAPPGMPPPGFPPAGGPPPVYPPQYQQPPPQQYPPQY
jgi:hypothetical protein